MLPPGALCLAVGNEGLICTVCGNHFAPDMMSALGTQQPAAAEFDESGKAAPGNIELVQQNEWIDIAQDIEILIEKTTDLARGISRGIVEAPAGHIGLMHYAKDFQKPEQKSTETDKNYELKVRTQRMKHLFDKIQEDTVGRIHRIAALLHRLGMPDHSS